MTAAKSAISCDVSRDTGFDAIRGRCNILVVLAQSGHSEPFARFFQEPAERENRCLGMKKDQDICQDERGQDQPKDKKRAQRPGLKEQREAAETQPQSPGEPAKSE